jgi:putative transposase
MCRALEGSPAGYYRWRARVPGARATQHEQLVEKIKAAHGASRSTYGSPKIYRQLRQQGEQVNDKRVARLMKEHGIRAKRVKKFTQTTDSRHSLPVAENVLGRHLRVPCPDAVWTSDITYIWTDECWLYLVVFLDLSSRLVVGWAVSESLSTEFVEQAFLQGQRDAGEPSRRSSIQTGAANTRAQLSANDSPRGTAVRV